VRVEAGGRTRPYRPSEAGSESLLHTTDLGISVLRSYRRTISLYGAIPPEDHAFIIVTVVLVLLFLPPVRRFLTR
jgi:hypothetical protein